MSTLIIIAIIFANILFVLSNIESSEALDNSLRILDNFKNQTNEEVFKAFHHAYNKNYNLTSEKGLARFNSFSKNLKLIQETNAQNLTYTLGIGPFTDLTSQEFKEKRLMNPEVLAKLINSTFDNHRLLTTTTAATVATPVTYVNWTKSYRPALDQGNCGSCWAFATTGALEANYQISFGTFLKFSSQQLVDCDTLDGGCNGGYGPNSLTYVQKNGIIYDDSYPYISGLTQASSTCKSSASKANLILSSTVACSDGTCTRATILSMLAKGPLIGAVDASDPVFQNYQSGIMNVACKSITHGINIVGVSNDTLGGYYIARSSWGTAWGENGYFRMRFNDTTRSCFMDTQAWRPVVTKTSLVPPPVPAPQCLKFYSGCKLQGTTYSLCQSQASFTKTQGLISGYTIGNATSVTLFNSANCRGSYFTYSGNMACFSEVGLSSYINNVGSAIINWTSQSPPQGCVWVYSGCCFLSTKLEICKNVPDLSVAAYKFANQINAVRLGPGVKSVTLATSTNYFGTYITYSGEDVTCVDTAVTNKINSLKFS